MEYRTPAEAVAFYNDAARLKVKIPTVKTFVSGMFSGFVIAMGSMVANTISFSMPNASAMRLVSSLLFPFGLAIILLMGTELFTGNALLAMPLANKKISGGSAARNLVLVFLGNFAGGAITAFCMAGFGQIAYGGGELAAFTIRIAANKCGLPFGNALVLGIFCNILVAGAVFVSLLSVKLPGKILFSYMPVCLFVVGGFEHCVANMYYIPAGLFAAANGEYAALATAAGVDISQLTWGNFLVKNLLPVTIGNIIGGALIGLFCVYMYKSKPEQ